jgi:hypothetical protein
LKPVYGVSNGTIIAFGESPHNQDFITFGNELASFLLKDENLNSIFGKKFRRRFQQSGVQRGTMQQISK